MPASLRPRRRGVGRRGGGPAEQAGRPARLPGLAGMGIGAVVVLVVGLAAPAVAQAADPTLGQVIDRLRNVLVGLLVGRATLFLTVGGCGTCSPGDPGQVEKAKVTLRSAAIGYGLAVLAPVLVRLLRYVVGS